MRFEALKVGELARRTGLTVRTLHHYDDIGLLRPSGRSGSLHGSGHRLYTAADVARLHQIVCLKQLGFSLDRIREYLTRPDYDPRRCCAYIWPRFAAARPIWRNSATGSKPWPRCWTGPTRRLPRLSYKPLR